MGLVAVIPAKASSTRVPNKNYRPFFGDKSLVDLLVEKLLRVLPGERIFLSCETEDKRPVADRHGINYHMRDLRLADNDTPLCDVFRGICDDVPEDDDVLWCEAIDPLFDEHDRLIRNWDAMGGEGRGHDSLTVVYPMKHYLLDQNHRPMGFGFGPYHIKSQSLGTFYRLNFTCAILTRESIARCGGIVGERPAWLEARNTFIDIDTAEDFEMARVIYAHLRGKQT